MSIPKIIHYCWFGKTDKPSSFFRCYNSWRHFCSDYEIIEWNEDNFDLTVCPIYVQEAYKEGKWAFVTDYARLKIIYDCGGIYFDTDVEVIKSLDDLLEYPAFFGYEDKKNVATGLGFGAVKRNKIVNLMMKDYNNICFIKENGEYDLTPCPQRNTIAISEYLEKATISSGIRIIDEAVFFPKEYFCPLDYETRTLKKTKNTYTIHWFDASWKDERERVLYEFNIMQDKCIKLFGKHLGMIIVKMIYRVLYPDKREILKTL